MWGLRSGTAGDSLSSSLRSGQEKWLSLEIWSEHLGCATLALNFTRPTEAPAYWGFAVLLCATPQEFLS